MSISIRNLSRSFDGKPVLTNFSCEFPEKGVVALMGKSGIGKSTLMNILLGLIAPDSGEITGADSLRFSAVFQEDRLIRHLTARQNLLITTGAGREEIDASLSFLGLDPEEKKPVKSFSGGMKRRVALARGVLFPADVLLMDEPFRGLDADTRELAVRFVLRHWHGRLVILVTHDEEEARLMGAETIIQMGDNEHER